MFAINTLNRSAQTLDGMWNIIRDPSNEGLQGGWFRSESAPLDRADEIEIPACWETVYPHYDGFAWLWKTVAVPDDSQGRRLFLHFGAVNYRAEVWVNGEKMICHEGGYLPFSFEISELADGAEELFIAVRVLSPPKDEQGIDGVVLKETPCWRSLESYNTGGIWQSVCLLSMPDVFVSDLYIRPNAALDGVDVELFVDSCGAGSGSVEMEVVPVGTEKAVGTTRVEWAEPCGGSLHAAIELSDPHCWSPDDPFLYELRFRLSANGSSDCGSERFGLRRLAYRDGRFELNGRRIFIKGVFHEGLYPLTLAAPPSREFVRDEIRKAKDLGFNLLRFWQIPIHPWILDAADELGMMLCDEPPIEWIMPTPTAVERCRNDLRDLILRDRNRPSVALWNVLNEGGISGDYNRRNIADHTIEEWEDSLIQKERDSFCKLVRSLDSTRLIVDDSGGWHSNANLYAENQADGLPFNDVHAYLHAPVSDAHLEEFRTVGAEAMDYWRTKVLADTPVFMTEFGYGSLPDFESILEEYAARGKTDSEDAEHHAVLFASLQAVYEKSVLSQRYGSIRELCEDTQHLQGEANALLLKALRANPRMTGYVMHALSAGGCILGAELFDTWRNPKASVGAIRRAQQDNALMLFLDTISVYDGESFSIRAHVLSPSAQVGTPIKLELALYAGDAVLSQTEADCTVAESGQPVWEGDLSAPQTGALTIHGRLLGADGIVLAEENRRVTVAARPDCSSLPPVAAIGGAHRLYRDWLRDYGVDVHENASRADLIVLSVNGRTGQLKEGFDALLESGKTILALGESWEDIGQMMGLLGVEAEMEDGAGNWSPVVHYFVDHRFQNGLPDDRFLSQRYAGMTPRVALATEQGEPLAEAISYITNNINRKQTEVWCARTLFRIPARNGQIVFSTLPFRSMLRKSAVAGKLFENLINYTAGLTGGGASGQEI